MPIISKMLNIILSNKDVSKLTYEARDFDFMDSHSRLCSSVIDILSYIVYVVDKGIVKPDAIKDYHVSLADKHSLKEVNLNNSDMSTDGGFIDYIFHAYVVTDDGERIVFDKVPLGKNGVLNF